MSYYLNTNYPHLLFKEALNSEIYVDKSRLIEKISAKINTGNKNICITRPRRFGKTINANMLGAYYTKGLDSHPLFDALEISGTEIYPKHMNQHNVIYIDFSRGPDNCDTYQDFIASIIRKIRADIFSAYSLPEKTEYDSVSEMLRDTGDSFIFILDEWDSVFYEDFMPPSIAFV